MPVNCSICGRPFKNKTVLKVHELYCKGPQANTENNPVDASVEDELNDEKSPPVGGNGGFLKDVEDELNDEPEKPGSHTHVKPAQTPNPGNVEISETVHPEEKKRGFFQQVEDELNDETTPDKEEKKGFWQEIEDDLSGKTADTEIEKKGNLSIDEELNA